MLTSSPDQRLRAAVSKRGVAMINVKGSCLKPDVQPVFGSSDQLSSVCVKEDGAGVDHATLTSEFTFTTCAARNHEPAEAAT
jgi:hypothetical protein